MTDFSDKNQQMNNDWVSYKEIDFTDQTKFQYHIDTRDFFGKAISKVADNQPNISKLKKYPQRFFFTGEEIAELVDRYYKESGGEGEWRYFSLKGVENWGLKYLHIYRTEYGLLMLDGDGKALTKQILNGEVELEHLSHQK